MQACDNLRARAPREDLYKRTAWQWLSEIASEASAILYSTVYYIMWVVTIYVLPCPNKTKKEEDINVCVVDAAPSVGSSYSRTSWSLLVGESYEDIQHIRLFVNDRKFSAKNSIFLSHQTSQQ